MPFSRLLFIFSGVSYSARDSLIFDHARYGFQTRRAVKRGTMKFDHLISFQQVAHTGSFTRAAQKLFITQPTVTQHIQSLEKELNTQLFFRSKSDTRLTPEGQILLQSVDAIFDILEETKASFLSHSENVAGDLSIGATTIMGTYVLPQYIARFIQEFRNVRFSLHYGSSLTISDWVQNGIIDLGFAPLSPGFAKLDCCFAHRESCACAVGKDSPLAAKKTLDVKDLSGLPIVVREKGTRIGEVVTKWMDSHKWPDGPPNIVICSDMDAIKKIVEHGAGLTILPESALKREFAFGLLTEVAIPDAALYLDYYLVHRQNSDLSQAALSFLRLMQELSGLDLRVE